MATKASKARLTAYGLLSEGCIRRLTTECLKDHLEIQLQRPWTSTANLVTGRSMRPPYVSVNPSSRMPVVTRHSEVPLYMGRIFTVREHGCSLVEGVVDTRSFPPKISH